MRATIVALTALVALAACEPPQVDPIELYTGDGSPEAPAVDSVSPPLGADGTLGAEGEESVSVDGALVEREPNTCRLEDYAELIGQPRSAAEVYAFDRPYRIVLPNDIVTQEYDPRRLNLQLDADGFVRQITCG